MRLRAGLIVVVAIVLVAGLYMLLHGLGSPSIAYEPQPRAFHLVVAEQRLTAGPTVLDATRGDVITLAVTVDRAATVHLHGYEKLLPVEPGREATLSFTAARAGWFPIGLHNADGSEITLSALQVQPPPQ
jgi:hypothetical protein